MIVQVIISLNNKNYKYLDEKHEIILGKSNKSKEDFDVIVFASRNIQEAIIPSYIKRINSYAFQNSKIHNFIQSDLNLLHHRILKKLQFQRM